MIVFLNFQVDSEKKEPHSQTRIASGKIPHMWGQSLYVLARLLIEVRIAAVADTGGGGGGGGYLLLGVVIFRKFCLKSFIR